MKPITIVIVEVIITILFLALALWGLLNYFEYAKELRHNPLTYGAQQYDLEYCNCVGENYKEFYFDKDKITYKNIESITIDTETNLLQNILQKEIIEVDDWVCYDYANHYNTTLSIKFPELDVRWIRHVDVCNNLTLCEDYHTFVVVGGYGSECILDHDNLVCVNLI